MRYHEARSAWFIGHCWGRGWRDAAENLLQTSIIGRLGSFPLRRICGTERSTTFSPAPRASSQVGDSAAWGEGSGSTNKNPNKQTNTRAQRHSGGLNGDTRRGWQAFCFSLFGGEQESVSSIKKQKKETMAAGEQPHIIVRTLCTRSVDARGWMRHIPSVDNTSAKRTFPPQTSPFLCCSTTRGRPGFVPGMSDIKAITLPHKAAATCPESIVLT